MSLASIQKTEQFLLFSLVLCATSRASCDLPVLPGPNIASVVVVWSLKKSFASSWASCDSRPTKDSFRKNGMIDGALPVASTSACSRLGALSCPSPYVIGIEMPRSPSRQYTMSSSSVFVRFSAHRIRSDVLNWSRGLLRSAASRMPVIPCMSYSSDALSPMRCPSREKNSTDTGAISSCSVHPQVNHGLAQNAAL
jgi:hypothetical protein